MNENLVKCVQNIKIALSQINTKPLFDSMDRIKQRICDNMIPTSKR